MDLLSSPSVDSLMAALAAAQGKMGAAIKGSTNPHFRSRYADLAAVVDACRGPLSEAGIAIVQFPSFRDGIVRVETRLYCKDQYVGCALEASAKDAGPQAIGSTITYLRRYGLMALCGLAPDDDDGEAAEGRPPQRREQAPKYSPPPDPPPAPPEEPSEEEERTGRLVADLARSVLAVDLPQERALRIARAYQDARARKGLSRDWGEVRDRLLALSGPELTKVLAIQQ